MSPHKRYKYVIGIDEVGRGPLAGPVTLGAVFVKELRLKNFEKTFHDVKDSKQLKEEKREELAKRARVEKKAGRINYAVSSVSHTIIDSRGLSFSIRKAVENCLKKLKADPKKTLVLLDGSLYAPKVFLFQQTIIKGDAKVKIISLASVVAKVDRDRKMRKLSKKYPNYGFEIHKGYGTAKHYEAIKKHGPSPIHRKSFLKKIN